MLAGRGLTLKVEEARRVDAEGARGPDSDAGAGSPGVRTRRQRSVRSGSAPARGRTSSRVFVGESERTAQMRMQQDGLELADAGGDPIGRLPGRRRWSRRRRRPRASADACRCWSTAASAAATYVMPDLIGVNGDRAADVLRARGFRVAVVGDHPYPGRARRDRPAAESAGRVPDCARRADFARGQPVNVADRPVAARRRLCRRLGTRRSPRSSTAAPI